MGHDSSLSTRQSVRLFTAVLYEMRLKTTTTSVAPQPYRAMASCRIFSLEYSQQIYFSFSFCCQPHAQPPTWRALENTQLITQK